MFFDNVLLYLGKLLIKMETLLTVFIAALSSLYTVDRLFSIVKSFIKGEKFEQEWYQRALFFLAISSIITLIII